MVCISLHFSCEIVSKNHQGQNFLVQVEEDVPQYSGVAPAQTPSVSIRSKRNKRQRSSSVVKSEGNNVLRSSESSLGIPLSRSPFSIDGAQVGSDIDRNSPIGFQGIYGGNEVRRLRDGE